MGSNWYRNMVFYQIWPRSFADGNGDGIGDLYGVYDKLDYLASLGVDGIWFSPLYVSPNADYGYDIADYRAISPEYGDMEIFEKVLAGAHARGMKVLMDLVVNHTSTDNEWFKKGRADKNSPYHDYYFWRKGKNGKLPNNWDSLFEGKAWEYDEGLGEYYLHLFAKGQPDLNMDNPAVRQEVKDIMRFWLEKGVDGFREDVITFISKKEGLPNDYFMPMAKGLPMYSNGPHLKEYLTEFKTEVLDKYDCITVGEAPMIKPGRALSYITGQDRVLDLMIGFDHMQADCFMSDYVPRPFSLRKLKRAFSNWQTKFAGKAWNCLYIENHDHPRVISRYGSEAYRVESGKMLAASYFFQQGTPFIYQGQEIGMTSLELESIDQYLDVATKKGYRDVRKKHDEEETMRIVRHGSREGARSPMQWSAEENAGFTTGKPWFYVNPNYKEVNVARAQEDPDSILAFYKKMIRMRKEMPVLIDGEYKEHLKGSDKLYVYSRTLGNDRVLVVCSFTEEKVRFTAPKGFDLEKGEMLLGNYKDAPVSGNGFETRPYETRVYRFKA